jgi:integrase
MLITVYTRHSSGCSRKADRYWRNCKCRKWLYIEGTRKSISAKTRSWSAAVEKAKEVKEQMERPGTSNFIMRPETMRQAVTQFLENKAQEGKGKAWNQMLQRDLNDFAEWCAIKLITPINVNTLVLEEYRKTWQGAPGTRQRRQTRLSHFLKYCVKHRWIEQNFATDMSKIKVPKTPTMPLTREEFERVIAAVEHYNSYGHDRTWRRQRAIAMLLLLRWSGLRIGDAAKLERSKLTDDGKLFLYTQKTGQPVYVPLPPAVVKMLRELPNIQNSRYFFWNGNGLPETPAKMWWQTLTKIFKKAGLPNAHPHMLRDTFAVEMLLAGVSLEEVAALLGHSNTKITESHYAAWVRARQERLERSVAMAWAADPSIASHSVGSNAVN